MDIGLFVGIGYIMARCSILFTDPCPLSPSDILTAAHMPCALALHLQILKHKNSTQPTVSQSLKVQVPKQRVSTPNPHANSKHGSPVLPYVRALWTPEGRSLGHWPTVYYHKHHMCRNSCEQAARGNHSESNLRTLYSGSPATLPPY